MSDKIGMMKGGPKARLLTDVSRKMGDLDTKKVADEMNQMFLDRLWNKIESLDTEQAEKLEAAIEAARQYDPSKDKFGFGPPKIDAMSFAGFMVDELGIDVDDNDIGDDLPNFD